MESKNSPWFYTLGALVIVLVLVALYFTLRSDNTGSTAHEDISSNLLAQSLRDAERQGRERARQNRERAARESNRDDLSWSQRNSNSNSAAYGRSIETAIRGSCNDCTFAGLSSTGQATFRDGTGRYYTGNVQGQRDGGNTTGSGFVGGSCTFADFGKYSWTDYLAGCGCYRHSVNAGDGTKDTDIRCRCDECELCNYCGDCAKGSAPPVRADFGNDCTSPANLCGATNDGTIECNGCTAFTPPLPADYDDIHTSTPNVCGDTNSVLIQCGNRATTPPNTQCEAIVGELSANPFVVRRNEPTNVTWSCLFADGAVLYNIANGDRFSTEDGTLPFTSETLAGASGEPYTRLSGTIESGGIVAQSDFILECLGEYGADAEGSVEIRLLPMIEEN